MKNKRIFKILSILLVIILLSHISIIIIRSYKEYGTIDDLFTNKTICFNGEYYDLKNNIDTYLVMGIDNAGGQADAIFLVITDNSLKEIFLIPINRNILAPIEVYSQNGEYLGLQNKQICLSHSLVYDFIDADKATVKSVSNLLFDLPIDFFVSLDMDGISYISDLVGELTITVNDDIPNTQFYKGNLVTVNKDNIEEFLRARDCYNLGGAQKRLERQTTFILSCYNKYSLKNGLFTSIKNLFTSNNNTLDNLKNNFKLLKPFITSNIDDPIQTAINYLTYDLDDTKIHFLPHTTSFNQKTQYEECYLEEAKTKQILLNIFYKKVLF